MKRCVTFVLALLATWVGATMHPLAGAFAKFAEAFGDAKGTVTKSV